MKRTLTICMIVLLTGAFLYACGIIPNSSTSFVTIRIGDNPQKAVLKAEAATPWARMKHVLAGVKLMPEAQAYIPSVVQSIIVTVTASDISTPIVGVDSIKDTDTVATVRIEVPNGAARQFLVEGIRGVDSKVYYRGAATADLAGTDVTLTVDMAFVGPGILVDMLHSQAADTVGCGTAVLPCKTITYALNSRTSGTDAILVSAGSYSAPVGGGGETFPLQLKSNTALVCLGSATSVIIDAYNGGNDAIYGDSGASIDNCTVIPDCDWIAIDDTVGGVNGGGQAAPMKINGVVIGSTASCPAWDAIMLAADSTVIETDIQDAWSTYINVTAGKPVIKANTLAGTANSTDGIYVASSDPVIDGNVITGMNGKGIAVLGGRPEIRNNTISLNLIGIDLSGGAGDVLVSANTISSNSTGVSVSSAGKPTISGNSFTHQFMWNGTGIDALSGNAIISGNTIVNQNYGIRVTDASPEITGNSISDNWIGIDISTAVGDPKVNGNKIYCNAAHDVGVNDPSAVITFDLRNNAWDHDVTTSPTGTPIPGPTTYYGPFSSLAGDDIFTTSPTPTPQYVPFGVAVPNGCLPPQGVGKPQRR